MFLDNDKKCKTGNTYKIGLVRLTWRWKEITRSINKLELEVQTASSGMTSDRGKQIKVTDDVYKDLTDIGKKNETYSQIIRRLIDEHRQRKQVK
jgi:hypothetical protein